MSDPALSYRSVGQEDSWPLLLVGPILRRVTPSSVAVFLATSRGCEVTLDVYAQTSLPLGNPIGGATSITYTLGKRLHVLVIEATDLDLQSGKLYGYNLSLNDGSQAQGLQDLGLLSSSRHAPLGYGADTLPGFVLPRERSKLKIIHMSCRKPHGGDPDMLPTVDQQVEAHHVDPEARPQQLLLTGDQIYADDVAMGLLHNLKAIGHALLDWDQPEELPDDQGSDTYADTHEKLALGKRDRFLEESGVKKATHYAVNHLLYFREWCAMYVMAWSDALWLPQVDIDVVSDLQSQWSEAMGDWEGSPQFNDISHSRYAMTPCQAFGRGFEETTPAVLRYAHYIQRTRRVLANVPTYMIFDDHEITDDWFLNGRFNLQLRGTPLGRRLMRNGLMAYAIFQDWGNRPEQYDPSTSLGKTFWEGVAVGGTSQSLSSPSSFLPKVGTQPDILDTVLDVGTSAVGTSRSDERLRWDFVIKGPEHRILFLDTRTWRHFPDEEFGLYSGVSAGEIPLEIGDMPNADQVEAQLGKGRRKLNAWLIGEDAQDMQTSPALSDLDTDTETLVVVSAAPVFGLWSAELCQRAAILYTELSRGSQEEGGDSALDNEPWVGNPTAVDTLLNNLSIGEPVLILSGDVHYAFTTYNLHRPSPGSGAQAFVQLCSSSAKNTDPLTRSLSASGAVVDAMKRMEWTSAQAYVKEMRDLTNPDDSPTVHFALGKLEKQVENYRHKYENLAQDLLQDPMGTGLDLAEQKTRQIKRDMWELTYNTSQEIKAMWKDPWSVVYGDVFTRVPLIKDQMESIDQSLSVDLSRIWLKFTETVTDERGAGRFDHDPDAKAWYEDLSDEQQRFWEKMDASSVGHTNAGIITFDRDHVVHDLVWYRDNRLGHLDDFHLVTEHRCDLANPPDPDSSGGGG